MQIYVHMFVILSIKDTELLTVVVNESDQGNTCNTNVTSMKTD